MQLINDIKQYFKADSALLYAEQYKEKSKTQPEYYLTYLSQLQRFKYLKDQIKNETMRQHLEGLEKILTEKK